MRASLLVLVALALPASASADHVTLWHSYRADEAAGLGAAVDRYRQLHPDVVVDLVAIPYDAYAYKLEAAIPRGNGPDLFVGTHDHLRSWVEAGLLQPLAGPPSRAADYLPNAVEALTIDGRQYGLPLAEKTLLLFYRSDRLDHAPATTDELIADAQRVGLAYEAGNMFYQAAWLHGFGGRLLDGHGRPALDSPAAVRALGFVGDLAARHLLPDESTSVLAAQLFNDGRAGLTINGPWFAGEIENGVPYRVAPLPVVSATGWSAKPLCTVEALLVPARSHSPAAATALADFLVSDEAARIRGALGRQPVATLSAWSDSRLTDDPLLAATRRAVDAAVPTPSGPAVDAMWEPAQRALRQVLRGARTPEQAAAEAERQVLANLQPPPPPANPLPYVLALMGVIAGWALWPRPKTVEVGERAPGLVALFLLPAALSMIVLVFVPLLVGSGMALYHYDAAGTRQHFVGFGNFWRLLGTQNGASPITQPGSFYFTLAVTIAWTLLNVTCHVALGLGLALLLRAPLGRMRGVYRALLIVPWAVPNYITALIWKGMFHRQFGAINQLLKLCGVEPISWFSNFFTSFFANVATNVWLGFPFMMVVSLGALSRIPAELEESAALDGAGPWQRFRHIILPLVAPQLWPSVVLGSIWTFNMFNIVFLVSGGEPDGATEILVSQAYRWAFTRGHHYGYAAAYALLIFGILWLFVTGLGRIGRSRSA